MKKYTVHACTIGRKRRVVKRVPLKVSYPHFKGRRQFAMHHGKDFNKRKDKNITLHVNIISMTIWLTIHSHRCCCNQWQVFCGYSLQHPPELCNDYELACSARYPRSNLFQQSYMVSLRYSQVAWTTMSFDPWSFWSISGHQKINC